MITNTTLAALNTGASYRARLDNITKSTQSPGFAFQEKMDSILSTAETFQSSTNALVSKDLNRREVLTIPNKGSLTKTADGFILSVLQSSNRCHVSSERDSKIYHFNSSLGTITCEEHTTVREESSAGQDRFDIPLPTPTTESTWEKVENFTLDLNQGIISDFSRQKADHAYERDWAALRRQ